MLFLPSLESKAPRYLKWSLCLSLKLLIVMLMSGGSSLRLITITSVFLLFSSSPFSLLFDCCRSFSFSEIGTVSSAYLHSDPWLSFDVLHDYFTIQRKQVRGEYASLSNPSFYFLKCTDLSFYSHCCSLFPIHIFDDS